jgi:hypothetical protein
MNLQPRVKVSTLFQSTSADPGSTGSASAMSTAGSSGGDSTTITGYPFSSTGIDMQGFDGVMFIANIAATSTSQHTLKAGFSRVSSTDAIANYVDLQGAYVSSPSSAASSLVLDVYRPTQRYLNATLLYPTSSGGPTSIVAVQYWGDKSPVSNSTAYSVFGTKLSISPTS